MAGTVNQSLPGKVDGRRSAPLPWMFPLRCLVCGERGAAGRDLCHACHAALPHLLARGGGTIVNVSSNATRGIHRVQMRHGVSRLLSGMRHTLGIIFHDAQS